MTTNTSLQPAASATGDAALHCALTGRVLRADEAYWAPPLITVSELLATVFGVGMRSPGQLGQLLFAEQPDVPYAPEARELLARRRGSEQAKLLGLILLLLALAVGLVLLML